ncbi:hypothetical protein TEA_020521 [Camellia sinensis var. sinensis]|uniref:Uncharacterized protein n=1 Tax=Camellia sinensis var. sinensis TaxID=542762 RepID=A0A4S4EXA3_CAMSN|nr:hypothetical protein TEA_020521 [Camellia sinensis var. sinensis]
MKLLQGSHSLPPQLPLKFPTLKLFYGALAPPSPPYPPLPLHATMQNKQILIDAVVHAVNEDYVEMANDFTRLGFLASGTDVSPIIPAWEASGRTVLVKDSLILISEVLQVAYPYVAKRLLTDPNPALWERLIQVIGGGLEEEGCEGGEGAAVEEGRGWEGATGKEEWRRRDEVVLVSVSMPEMRERQMSRDWQVDRKLDLTDTIKDGARLFLVDEGIRRQLLLALTEDSKLHIQEVLFKDGVFQWKRLENLIVLANENVAKMSSNPALKVNNTQTSRDWQVDRILDLTDTIKDGARLFLVDEGIRRQLLLALTEDSKLHIQEIYHLLPGISCFPGLIPFYLIDDQSCDVYASIPAVH